jgi:hypothetical protein
MISSIFNFLFNLAAGFNTGPSILLDAPAPWQIGFQDVASPGFEGIVALHDSIMFYLILILVSVFWIMFSLIRYFSSAKSGIVYKYLNHGTVLELIWTVSPALVLIAIAFPSFKLLYTLDEVVDPALTVKVTGFSQNGLKSNILNKIKDTVTGLKSFIQQLIRKTSWFFLHFLFFVLNKKTIFKLIRLCLINTSNSNNLNSIFLNNNRRSVYNFYIPLNRALFHTNCRAINRIGPHDQEIISVIFGLLLGDGYAGNRSGEGVRIAIRQSIIHKEYLFYLYNFFFTKGYCSNLEPRQYTRTLKGIEKVYYGYEFNTFTFRSFYWIYESFYKNGRKVMPLNLELYFTPLSLAILISDDGGYTNAGVRIATNNFNFNEVEMLANILRNKFNLDVTIQKIGLSNKFSVYIKKNSMVSLRELVLHHMHKSMHYKLGV